MTTSRGSPQESLMMSRSALSSSAILKNQRLVSSFHAVAAGPPVHPNIAGISDLNAWDQYSFLAMTHTPIDELCLKSRLMLSWALATMSPRPRLYALQFTSCLQAVPCSSVPSATALEITD